MSNPQQGIEDRRRSDGKFGAGRSAADQATADARAGALDDAPRVASRFKRVSEPPEAMERIFDELRRTCHGDEANLAIVADFEADTDACEVFNELTTHRNINASLAGGNDDNECLGHNDEGWRSDSPHGWHQAAESAGFEVEHVTGDREEVGDILIDRNSLLVVTGTWTNPRDGSEMLAAIESSSSTGWTRATIYTHTVNKSVSRLVRR